MEKISNLVNNAIENIERTSVTDRISKERLK